MPRRGNMWLSTAAATAAMFSGAAFYCQTAGAQSPPAPPGSPSNTIVVFDGSNSMNGKIAGEGPFKYVLVRDALRGALAKYPTGHAIGLAAFGHRRPSDCSDAEVIQTPATDTSKTLAPLEKFQPKGYSPVILAMRAAAKALPAAGAAGKSSMVIVLDDLASCRGEDPCKVAGELKKDNAGLAIHVVGLGLKPNEVQIMGCVAQQTGGKLFDAQDPAAATAGIEQALQLASAAPVAAPAANTAASREAPAGPVKGAPKAAAAAPPTSPPRTTTPAANRAAEPLGPGLHLSARLADGRAPLEQSVRWRVMREGASPMEPLLADTSVPTLNLQLPNGRYVVEAQSGLVTVSQVVEITAAGPLPVQIPLNAGLLSLSAPLNKGGEPSRTALISVFQPAGGGIAAKPLWLSQTGADDLVVPAGTYRVVAEDGLVRTEQTIQVGVGARREVELPLAAGRLVVDANFGGTNLIMDNVQFLIEEDDPDSPTGKKEIMRTAAPRLDLTLPAGSYQVTVRRGAAESRERVAVKAGEDTSRSITLAAGRVRLAAKFGAATPAGLPITYKIDRLDGPPRTITRTGVAEPVIDLSPGRYRIEARLGGQNAVAASEIDVPSGMEQRVEFTPSAGGIRLKLAPQIGGLGFGEVFWQVADERGRAVWRTSQVEPLLVLAAGRYSVTIEMRERTLERTFEVKAGENRVLEISG